MDNNYKADINTMIEDIYTSIQNLQKLMIDLPVDVEAAPLLGELQDNLKPSVDQLRQRLDDIFDDIA